MGADRDRRVLWCERRSRLDAQGLMSYVWGMKSRKLLKVVGISLGLLVVVVVVLGMWLAAVLKPDVTLGTIAPTAAFSGVDGQPVQLESLRGKLVLLDFWSST